MGCLVNDGLVGDVRGVRLGNERGTAKRNAANTLVEIKSSLTPVTRKGRCTNLISSNLLSHRHMAAAYLPNKI